MALTAYDIARFKEDNYAKGIVNTLIEECDVLKIVPIENIGTLAISTRRANSLPAVNFRARGSRYTDGGAVGFETVTDAVYDIGTEITLDKADMKDKGPYITNPLEYNTKARVKSMKFKINDAWMNGDHATDPNSFEGVIARHSAMAAAQTTTAASAGAEDIRVSAITDATARAFLNSVDDAVYALDGNGKGAVCFTDADYIRGFKRCLRQLGLYNGPVAMPTTKLHQRDTSADMAPFPHFEWDGIKFVDMGLKSDQSTKIVGTETVNGVTCRPAFYCRLGEPYLHFIQLDDLDVSEPFMLDDGVSWRIVVGWMLGTRHVHPKSISKHAGARVA